MLRHPIWIWRGQWKLDGWQNQSIFLVLFVAALWLASKRSYSFMEFLGQKLDKTFVTVLQK